MDELLEDEGKLGHRFTSAEALKEVDIGDRDRPRPTFISAKLDHEYKQELVELLKEYKDCFAWEYYEMPGLDRSIVEHQLPIKPGYRPHQQGSRRCNSKILPDIKAEITKLIEAKFIRQCRYAEWISNVVPVYKKKQEPACVHRFQRSQQSYADGWLPNASCRYVGGCYCRT